MSYQIELRHMRYFLAVAEELHFRKAAEKLFISQPGLSRQIKQMEEILDTPLFVRDKKKVLLTPAGMYLKGEVEFILNHLELTQKQLKTIFYGVESNTFWDSFLLETQIHENLYELISIKMRNIYSLVLNDRIKKIVLEGIFCDNKQSILISESTQQEFPDELKSELRENLSNTLDYIINSSWKDEIKCLINENTTLVISKEFLENNVLKMVQCLNSSFMQVPVSEDLICEEGADALRVTNYS